MSRALRRQPLVQKPPAKGPSFRPGGRPQKKAPTPAQAEAARQRPFLERIIPQPVRDVISELRKVTWPTREETTRLTVVVIVVAVAIGLALGAVDIGFNWLVEETLLR
jgi:preprotein translocase subunit SecE